MEILEGGDVDSWGWLGAGGYCAMTWVKLRYALGNLRAMLEPILSAAEDTRMAITVPIVEIYSLMWNNLPRHLKYPGFDRGKATWEQTGQISLLLASIYLEFLSIKLEAHDRIGQYDLADALAQEMISIILELSLNEKDKIVSMRGYSSIVVHYGIPAACVLLRHRALILTAKDSDCDNIIARWGETIRNMASFISRLDIIIERQGKDLDSLRDARHKLVTEFDAVVDRFGARYDKDETTEPVPWNPLPSNISTFDIELKDNIWRL
ncbi:hypothetical protein ABKA04_004628 [Annulohypoxylon sp. FPYF3050]